MQYFRSFILGVLTIAVLHMFATCSEGDGGAGPNDDPPSNVDVTAINEGAQKVEEAFATADPQKVAEILTEEAKAFYAEELDGIQDRMAAFSKVIQTRTLKTYSEYYAEYSYTDNGSSYTLTLALQEDGAWKLMRF
ncbi:MAG: hypothetical protein GXO82_10975 [Chlorobi bacterium]|nr:hypothetical protein [Chlorobiota bacterium]